MLRDLVGLRWGVWLAWPKAVTPCASLKLGPRGLYDPGPGTSLIANSNRSELRECRWFRVGVGVAPEKPMKTFLASFPKPRSSRS